jgi:dynein heavy chain
MEPEPEAITNEIKYKQITDARILWIKNQVESSLENELDFAKTPPNILTKTDIEFKISTTTQLFEECMYSNQQKNLDGLNTFLQDNSNSALIFWTEKAVESIHVETLVHVETAKEDSEKNPTLRASNGGSLSNAVSPQILEAGQAGVKDEGNATVEKPENTEEKPVETAGEILPVQEKVGKESQPVQDVTTTRIEIVSIHYEVTKLRMSCEGIPDNLAETNCIYFLRNKPGPMTAANMPEFLEIGFLSNQALLMLEQVLNTIYLPMLSQSDFNNFRLKKDGEEIENDQTQQRLEQLKQELLVTIQRFSSHISHTVQQVAGETRLKIPDELAEIDTIEEHLVLQDPKKLSQLDNLAEEWIETIQGALLKETLKTPNGNGPLQEIEFWRDKSSSLSTLYEQLNLPIVHKIVKIFNVSQKPSCLLLESQLAELNKVYSEAKDNVKFLGTLERHFKNITIGSLNSIEVLLN